MNATRRPLSIFGTWMDSNLLRPDCGMEIVSLNPQPAEIEGFERPWVLHDDYPVLAAQ